MNGTVLDGNLPKRALSLVKEWVKLHKDELLENWHRAKNGMPLNIIKPLE